MATTNEPKTPANPQWIPFGKEMGNPAMKRRTGNLFAKLCVLTALLYWSNHACSQTTNSQSHPEIVLQQGIITVDGQKIAFPTTFAEFKRIFGEPTRSLAKINTIHVWDELGIYCYVKPSDEKITSFVLAAEHESYSYAPKRPFTGILRIGDVTIPMDFSASSIREINTKLNGQTFTPDDTLPFIWKRADGTIETALQFSDDGAGQEVVFNALANNVVSSGTERQTMSTLIAVVILIVIGFSGQLFWLTVLNLAGMPGALIGVQRRERPAGHVRTILGTILSVLGQSYVYLAYVAIIVLLAKYFIPEQHMSPFFVWPAAFFACVFPIYCCAAAAGVEAGSTPQITAVLIGQFVAVIGFFVFVFFPNMIWGGWPWIDWLLRWLSSSS